MTQTPGSSWPLGAHADSAGVNFAVFSREATAIDLCVFDSTGAHETARVRLGTRSGDVWHGHLAGAQPGLVYGLRAHGRWKPEEGRRFNPAKLLLDPWAREIVGQFEWDDRHFGADREHPLKMDDRDNAAIALKARVTHDAYDWGDDRPPSIALANTVLYELHVKGYSMRNPAVPQHLRGTFAGLGHRASTDHLRRLGITAVSLLPVQHRLDEERLVRHGLTNYWGYNTIGFFAPDPRLGRVGATGAALRDEFRGMVRALHAAGIEVILDVVFNHTAESDASGPTLSLRGLDNAAYYRLDPLEKARYENFTGCGNTVDLRHPRVLQWVMDCLRYWVSEMHVDGFRFDLAPVLGRGNDGFDRNAAFFMAVAQDPVLRCVKMIAEPWDLGPGGHRTGDFPNGWADWNDRFRNDMRGFWLRHPVARGDFARRLCASSDLFHTRERAPAESVNYVVSHDGFTLRDLLTYRERRNAANGEDNRDGSAVNFGLEIGAADGPTDDAGVNALRGRLQRALLATLMFAQGTPMLCAGDEFGRTQHGNNNAYCHDNELSWLDWNAADTALIAFTARAIALRHAVLPFANRWYGGPADPLDPDVHELAWLDRGGHVLHGDAWHHGATRTLGCLIARPGRAAKPLLLLINADAEDRDFVLPAGTWQPQFDSAHETGEAPAAPASSTRLRVAAASLVLLASSTAHAAGGAG